MKKSRILSAREALGRVFSFSSMDPVPSRLGGKPPMLLRRNFMRNVAGGAVALPLLHTLGCSEQSTREAEQLGQAKLAENGFPKRFIVVYTPNGNFEFPKNLELAGTQHEALIPYLSKMIFLNGLDMSVCDNPPGEPHQSGMAFLTGRRLNTGNQVGGDGSLAGWGSGVSLDHELAEVIGATTPRKALHLGVQSTNYGGTEVRTVISYKGGDQPNENEISPWVLYDEVFASLGADPFGVAKLKNRRKSVLDLVGKQYEALAPKVGSDDQKKLEQHLDAVRDLEKQLDNPGAVLGGSCQLPDLGGGPIDVKDPNNFPIVGKLFMDQAAMALACDITRVVTLQWSASTNNRPYPWLQYDDGTGLKPITDDEHVLGHQPDTDVHAWGKLNVIRHWYGEQFAYLLSKLASVPEGEGTMLDNTVVLFASEISRGNTHSHKDMPFILAGSGGGYFKTGQYLSFDGDRPHNDLLVAIANALGHPIETFGEEAYVTGALSGLT
ncbi:MAG: DUF1552 domain-containing protein [Polyangiaceae bacterium]|nr:DUF1552 domain-containing protein [Polyangiaceae bacterium]